MTVANHEASDLDFPGLQGIFDKRYRKVTSSWIPAGWLIHGGGSGVAMPYSGVMAEAVQTVAVTSRNSAENLLAIGNKGHAGYSKRFGGVDVTVDAVLTDNFAVSGAYGYQLSDFDAQLQSGLILYTTNGTLGRAEAVSGLYVTSISFNFNANGNSTTSWSFVGDGVIHSGYTVATQGLRGNTVYHCVNPLTWDEVNIFDGSNSVVLTGVQSVTFTANINRSEIFQIGQFTPYDRAVQYPYDVSVSINTLANDVNLVNWWSKFVPSYDPMGDCANGMAISLRAGSNIAGVNREMIIASGLRPTTSTLNTAVGSNSTVALSFAGTDLRF